jgi:electron transport complex protein RnfC
MTGGLVFGPPAWLPERIEDTFDFKGKAVETPVGTGVATTFLAEREAQISFLERIGIGRASATIPGLVEQLRAAPATAGAEKGGLHLVLNLMPTQPEYAMASALSRLALDDLSTGVDALSNAARYTWIVMDRQDFRMRRLWRRAIRARAVADHNAAVKKRFRFRYLLNRYPQGDPTILLRTLFRKKLPVGAMPTTQGVLMVDPVSCWAVGRWLRTGQTFTDRPVQLFATEHESPRLVLGRIGEPLAEFCQRHKVSPEGMQVIVNGMLSGREVDPQAARIDSQTESVTLRSRPDIEPPAPCIACGWCVDVCPTDLQPISLLQLAQRLSTREPDGPPPAVDQKLAGSPSAREARHCVGCGLCSYVCPTRLPLMRETLRLKQFAAAASSDTRQLRESR